MARHDPKEMLNAILRKDFLSFVEKVFNTLSPGQKFIPGWHLQAIAYQLDRVWRGEITRLIINMPPRSLKSIITSVAYPAFVLGHNPTLRFLCASYSADLAVKHSNDFRTILRAPWYQEIFPATRIGRYKDTELEIELTQRGFRMGAGVGGTLTGRGGTDVIIDDPMKPADALSELKRNATNDWSMNTVLSRLDNKMTGSIVVVMQRLHMDDLTGFLLRQSKEWTVLSLPAIALGPETIPLIGGGFYHRQAGEVLSPHREPLEVLESLKMQMGSDVFSAQYQQQPVPPGGLMVKRHWVNRYSSAPGIDQGIIFQSWDTAAKGGPDNDWSVCSTWLLTMDHQWYLLDIWRGRVDYPTLKAKVVELAQHWHANEVLVEEAGTAIGLLQELKHQVRGIIGVKPKLEKQARMSIASAKFEAGQVYFPERASWLAELEAELFSFPGGSYDDQVDSISQALNRERSTLLTWRKLGSQP